MKDKHIKLALLWCGSAFMLAFCLTPFAYMVITSLSANPQFLAQRIPFEPTLGHYGAILASSSFHFFDYLKNSILVSAASGGATILIASLAAYAITRLRLPGKGLILFFVLSASMFPQVSLISYLFKLMAALDLINTHLALIFPYIAWTLPLTLWILVSYFLQIPKDLDKAALVDGCSRRQILQKVIFPVAAPGIFSAALLAFIYAFNEFMFALLLTTDHQARTIPVGIALFEGLYGETPWGEIMAASTLSTLPLIALSLIFQKNIIQGLTRGATKG